MPEYLAGEMEGPGVGGGRERTGAVAFREGRSQPAGTAQGGRQGASAPESRPSFPSRPSGPPGGYTQLEGRAQERAAQQVRRGRRCGGPRSGTIPGGNQTAPQSAEPRVLGMPGKEAQFSPSTDVLLTMFVVSFWVLLPLVGSKIGQGFGEKTRLIKNKAQLCEARDYLTQRISTREAQPTSTNHAICKTN